MYFLYLFRIVPEEITVTVQDLLAHQDPVTQDSTVPKQLPPPLPAMVGSPVIHAQLEITALRALTFRLLAQTAHTCPTQALMFALIVRLVTIV